MANIEHGGDRKSQETNSSLDCVTIGEAAELLNVGTTGVKLARKVLDAGAPELLQAVKRGDHRVAGSNGACPPWL